jgi:hypothetical protein
MGTMSSRVIGIIYVHKDDPEKLRLARLGFFGSRIDEVMEAKSFSPITDLTDNPGDAYVDLQLLNPPKREMTVLDEAFPFLSQHKYYLSLKYGRIIEPKTFMDTFGDISEFLSKQK